MPRSQQGVLAKSGEAQSSVRLLQERNIYILLAEASSLSFVMLHRDPPNELAPPRLLVPGPFFILYASFISRECVLLMQMKSF